MEKIKVKTTERKICPVCGDAGKIVYTDLEDTMFNIEGKWNTRKCQNAKCQTLWLDPAPEEHELEKLYANYPTHENAVNVPLNPNFFRNFLERVRVSYLSGKYGYKNNSSKTGDKLLSRIAHLHPGWKDSQEVSIAYFPARDHGLMLDVGCGAGNFMLKMREKGWKVLGLDFDEKAIQNARSKNLEALKGDLQSQNFPEGTFDAVIMNHLVEHVPRPVELLKECYRVLKKGGTMVAITPNAGSWAHLFFKHHWRGLEVPTHLQIFTVKSLKKAALKAGFQNVKSFSSIQSDLYIWNSSFQMSKNGTFALKPSFGIYAKLKREIKLFILGWLNFFFPNRNEVAVIVCTK